MSASMAWEIFWIAVIVLVLAAIAIRVIVLCIDEQADEQAKEQANRESNENESYDETLDEKNSERYIAEGLIPDRQSFDKYKTAYLGNGSLFIGNLNKERHKSFYNYLIWYRDIGKAAIEKRMKMRQQVEDRIKGMTTAQLDRYVERHEREKAKRDHRRILEELARDIMLAELN